MRARRSRIYLTAALALYFAFNAPASFAVDGTVWKAQVQSLHKQIEAVKKAPNIVSLEAAVAKTLAVLTSAGGLGKATEHQGLPQPLHDSNTVAGALDAFTHTPIENSVRQLLKDAFSLQLLVASTNSKRQEKQLEEKAHSESHSESGSATNADAAAAAKAKAEQTNIDQQWSKLSKDVEKLNSLSKSLANKYHVIYGPTVEDNNAALESSKRLK